jgi:hypothetical protein
VTGDPLEVHDLGSVVTLGLHSGNPPALVLAQGDQASRVELMPFVPSAAQCCVT